MAKGQLKVRLVGDASNLQKTLGGATKSISGFGKKFGGAAKLIGKTAKVGAMGAGALGGAAAAGAFKVAEFGDEVAKSAGKAGLGVEQFQELRFAFGQGGVEAETMDRALLKFNKRLGESATTGGTADDAFKELGVSLRGADGNVRGAGGAMDEVLPKLGKIESDAERAALAGDLFGQRAGPEMAAALSEGAGGIEEARQKAQELGIVMGEDAARKAEQFTDSWDDIKQSTMGLFRDGLTPLMGMLSDKVFPFIQGSVIPALKQFGEWVGRVTDAFREGGLSEALGMIGDQLAEFAPIIAEKLRELGQKFVAWVKPMIPPMLARLGELLSRVGQWIVGTALPAIGEKLVEWGKALVEWVGPQIPPLLRELGRLLGKLADWIVTDALPAVVKKLVEWGKGFAEWVGPAIPPMLSELGKLLADLGRWLISDALPTVAKKLVEWSLAFADWVLTDALPWLIENAWKLQQKLARWIVNDALPGLVSKLVEWATAFADWVMDEAWPKLKLEAAKLAAKTLIWIGEKVTDLKDKFGEWVSAFTGWVGDAKDGVLDRLGDLADDVIEWAKKLPGRILDALGNLGSKLADKFSFDLPGISFSGSGDGPGADVPNVGGSTRNRVQAAMKNIPGLQITSSYRTAAENARVGGSPTSYHMDRANPAIDIGGSQAALDQLHSVLKQMGGWRELIWRAPGHYDHVHVAHEGGRVIRDGIAPLKSDELMAKLQTGETVLPRGATPRGNSGRADQTTRELLIKLDKIERHLSTIRDDTQDRRDVSLVTALDRVEALHG